MQLLRVSYSWVGDNVMWCYARLPTRAPETHGIRWHKCTAAPPVEARLLSCLQLVVPALRPMTCLHFIHFTSVLILVIVGPSKGIDMVRVHCKISIL